MEGKHLIPNQEIGRSTWCPMISFEDLPLGHSTSWFWYLCSQTFYTWVSGGHWTPKYVGPCLVLHLLTSTCLCSPPTPARQLFIVCLLEFSVRPDQGRVWSACGPSMCVLRQKHISVHHATWVILLFQQTPNRNTHRKTILWCFHMNCGTVVTAVWAASVCLLLLKPSGIPLW